ncbi:hypothetical protein Mal52_42160 [Symmachiella dynata]|uniref:Uncharacterized protein n=1 Tax=Symmachiella dynata TaxID=2527995 RepID=A0A517ZTA7_9PLAN|nr:hypothetical protein Mal52_42160 [Symmachiella dynata]
MKKYDLPRKEHNEGQPATNPHCKVTRDRLSTRQITNDHREIRTRITAFLL